MLRLTTPLGAISGVSPRLVTHLKKLGIETVQDLLWHFPTRYEDFSALYRIADLEPGQQATVQGVVETIDVRRAWRRRNLTIVEATVRDETGTIRAVWFNQPYVKNILRPGRRANFSGKVTLVDHELSLSHPLYEPIPDRVPFGANAEPETKHTARLIPIYPETKGLTSKGIRFLTQPILKNLPAISEWIPGDALRAHALPDLETALRAIHFPGTLEEAARARRRFTFEGLFLLHLSNLTRRETLVRERARAIPVDVKLLKALAGELPFTLTLPQKKVLWEILRDMAKPHPMNRLLQGDVGSGKTIVAALAALLAADADEQTAFMAPTEVLALQHFATFEKLYPRIRAVDRPAVGLITGSGATLLTSAGTATPLTKEALRKKIASGDVMIVMGTHALISVKGGSPPSPGFGRAGASGGEKSVRFRELGLVIVDEQHRFGVSQRQALARGQQQTVTQTDAVVPHFLSMSATPIPRTLMLTMFGDLDISTITELPAGRRPVVTKIVAPTDRPKAYAFIRTQIKKGRQVFVICPRIEPQTDAESPRKSAFSPRLRPASDGQARESAILEMKSVKEEYDKLSKTIFPDLRVAMLHGQIKSKEKEKIMRDFREGKTDVLVCTSVVEVGVDVPNATIMMIEGSDRFGLAQLYQFRGRVGRGAHQSYCLLFTDLTTNRAQERLRAIIEAKNGFELAERDLKLRGPGEFLGERQTGLPDVAMEGLRDPALIASSRAAALAVIRRDPDLAGYPLLKERVGAFEEKLHPE